MVFESIAAPDILPAFSSVRDWKKSYAGFGCHWSQLPDRCWPKTLCGNAFITVMKAAQLRDCDDPPDFGHLPRNWALLVQPQVGAGSVVVAEIRSGVRFRWFAFRMTK
jgi:hypothetical protein